IAGANHPAIADSISQPHARTEITRMHLTGRVVEFQNLCVQVEDGSLIILLRGRKVKRIAAPDVQREPSRNSPVIADEELGNMGARLNDLLLNIDGECVPLP